MTSDVLTLNASWRVVFRSLGRLATIRPTVPLITAIVACLVLVRGLSGMLGADHVRPAALAMVASAVAEPAMAEAAMVWPNPNDTFLLPALEPVFAIEPAAGPEDTMAAAEEEATHPTSTLTLMTVDGLEDVARDLVERREKLEAREAQLELLEQALSANRQDIEVEIGRLEQLRDEISNLIVQVDEQEEQRLRQLVKVYETMKAKRAAAIFDRLDMSVLMPVAKRMRETKLASVMAAMDPGKARLVTGELARALRLPALN